MKRILLLLFVSMLMAESAIATCVFTIDDFTVTPDQIGTEIALPVKAYFSARVNAWQVDFTYPEGLTPTYAEAGADFGISYINSNGGTAICTPLFVHNNDYSRVIAVANEFGYWYDPDTDDLTNYGTVKWEGGTYEEMFILYVEVTEDFHGGQIIMTTVCSSGYDSRGETVRENGDHGVSFTSECNVTLGGPEAYACYTPSNTTLTFYYDNQRSRRPGTTYDLNTEFESPGWLNDLYDQSTNSLPITRVVFDPSFANARPTSTSAWFAEMQDLTSIEGIQYLNTSEVTSMSFMFYWCFGLTSLDLSNFNTSNVTTMADMFDGCYRLTGLDLSSFNTEKVTFMGGMFAFCFNLKSLDLSSFSTAAVTDMSDMFSSCESLTTIYAGSGWSTAAVTSSDLMFNDCMDLVGGMGTAFDFYHVDAAYAHLDGGPSNPGYFTAKNAGLRGDVDNNGEVKIGDVTALINYLLSGDASAINLQAADCDQNGEIKIGDVTALINYLLSGAW